MSLKIITDKDLIVYLAAKGLEIKDIQKDPKGNRSLVYFNDDDSLRQSTINYANKSDSVNIAEIIAAERRVKTLLCLQKN